MSNVPVRSDLRRRQFASHCCFASREREQGYHALDARRNSTGRHELGRSGRRQLLPARLRPEETTPAGVATISHKPMVNKSAIPWTTIRETFDDVEYPCLKAITSTAPWSVCRVWTWRSQRRDNLRARNAGHQDRHVLPLRRASRHDHRAAGQEKTHGSIQSKQARTFR